MNPFSATLDIVGQVLQDGIATHLMIGSGAAPVTIAPRRVTSTGDESIWRARKREH